MKRRHFLATLAALPLLSRFAPAGGGPCVVRQAHLRPNRVRPAPWTSAPTLWFFAIGDWGTGGSLQKKVAEGMDFAAGRAPLPPDFVLSTGDNIYPDGVKSATDKQWTSKFERIYTGSNIQVPWWAVLGNHDYRSDPDAQVAYGMQNSRWHMPGRTWSNDFKGRNETVLSVFGLDTQALLTRADGWKDQIAWLEKSLSECQSTWKIVVGHHPLRSYGHYGDQAYMVNNVKPLLDTFGVQAYVCGHDHDMQVIKHPTDLFYSIVSGGGGGARNTAYGEHTHFADTNGGFAAVLCSSNRMDMQVFDASGNETYAETISIIG
ncbi:MAG: metallophosphoesterase [bacterium]|nr:metallophosphoesterase [bacterium]